MVRPSACHSFSFASFSSTSSASPPDISVRNLRFYICFRCRDIFGPASAPVKHHSNPSNSFAISPQTATSSCYVRTPKTASVRSYNISTLVQQRRNHRERKQVPCAVQAQHQQQQQRDCRSSQREYTFRPHKQQWSHQAQIGVSEKQYLKQQQNIYTMQQQHQQHQQQQKKQQQHSFLKELQSEERASHKRLQCRFGYTDSRSTGHEILSTISTSSRATCKDKCSHETELTQLCLNVQCKRAWKVMTRSLACSNSAAMLAHNISSGHRSSVSFTCTNGGRFNSENMPFVYAGSSQIKETRSYSRASVTFTSRGTVLSNSPTDNICSTHMKHNTSNNRGSSLARQFSSSLLSLPTYIRSHVKCTTCDNRASVCSTCCDNRFSTISAPNIRSSHLNCTTSNSRRSVLPAFHECSLSSAEGRSRCSTSTTSGSSNTSSSLLAVTYAPTQQQHTQCASVPPQRTLMPTTTLAAASASQQAFSSMYSSCFSGPFRRTHPSRWFSLTSVSCSMSTSPFLRLHSSRFSCTPPVASSASRYPGASPSSSSVAMSAPVFSRLSFNFNGIHLDFYVTTVERDDKAFGPRSAASCLQALGRVCPSLVLLPVGYLDYEKILEVLPHQANTAPLLHQHQQQPSQKQQQPQQELENLVVDKPNGVYVALVQQMLQQNVPHICLGRSKIVDISALSEKLLRRPAELYRLLAVILLGTKNILATANTSAASPALSRSPCVFSSAPASSGRPNDVSHAALATAQATQEDSSTRGEHTGGPSACSRFSIAGEEAKLFPSVYEALLVESPRYMAMKLHQRLLEWTHSPLATPEPSHDWRDRSPWVRVLYGRTRKERDVRSSGKRLETYNSRIPSTLQHQKQWKVLVICEADAEKQVLAALKEVPTWKSKPPFIEEMKQLEDTYMNTYYTIFIVFVLGPLVLIGELLFKALRRIYRHIKTETAVCIGGDDLVLDTGNDQAAADEKVFTERKDSDSWNSRD